MVSRIMIGAGRDGNGDESFPEPAPRRVVEVVVNGHAPGVDDGDQPVVGDRIVDADIEGDSVVTIRVDGKVAVTIYMRNPQLSDHTPNAMGLAIWTEGYNGACTRQNSGDYRI